jgi:hypothetical protein
MNDPSLDPRLAAVRRTALDSGPKTGVDPLHEIGVSHSSGAFLGNAAKRGVLAYHGLFCAYGSWLPNDPRGSWSDFVASWELFRAGGPATKTLARHSLANVPHDAQARRQ